MVIIGKGLGDTAVAAVGNFTTFSFFITGFIMGVTNGFSVVISQAYGEKDFASFKRAAASSITLSILSALYLTGIGLWCLRPVLRIMQTDQTLVKDCLSYDPFAACVRGNLRGQTAWNQGISVERL